VESGYGLDNLTMRPQGSGFGQRGLAEGKGSLFTKAKHGCPPRFIYITTVDRVGPRRVQAARSAAVPLGFKNPGHPCRVIVLAWAPVMGGFKVRQSQDAHRGDGLESTDYLVAGSLDESHVGFAKAVPGGKDVRRAPCSFYWCSYSSVLWPFQGRTKIEDPRSRFIGLGQRPLA